jgi:hypothetical protein
VLQLEDGLGVEEVVLAVAPPLVLAARIELGRGRRCVRTRGGAADDFFGDDADADAADARRGPGEVLVDERLSRPTASKICAPQ